MTGTQMRHEIFEDSAQRLSDMAYRAVHDKGYAPADLALVAIHVDDPEWTDLADTLMSGADWQQFRDRGEKPIARGSVMREGVAKLISKFVPDLAEAISVGPPDGHLHAFVMDGGGASLYTVRYNPKVVTP